jgi:lipoate-protein ligase A
MKYIKTDWDVPFYNMALEEYVITEFPRDEDFVFFYIHSPSVIVGRHQNTLEEVNRDYAEQNHIYVARRLSGGGAVYHDRGNLNYSVVTAENNGPYDFSALSLPVRNALRALGVDAQLSGRNDLTIDGKKFSGAAQFSHKKRLLHHGTLLFDSDLSSLEKSLNVSPLKIESKGVQSVRSRVTNICDHLPRPIGIEAFRQRVLDHLTEGRDCSEYGLTAEDVRAVERRVKDKFSTWDWNWGQSPQYSLQKIRKFPCGIVDLRLDIDQGTIRGLTIFGDFFSRKDVAGLTETLIGTKYSKADLADALSRIRVGE